MSFGRSRQPEKFPSVRSVDEDFAPSLDNLLVSYMCRGAKRSVLQCAFFHEREEDGDENQDVDG